jgi:hypothetical protein
MYRWKKVEKYNLIEAPNPKHQVANKSQYPTTKSSNSEFGSLNIGIQSLSRNRSLCLNPPLKKGDIGGFASDCFGKIPPTPLFKRGHIIYGQVLRICLEFGI